VTLAGKSALCVIGMGFYEPWIDIAKDGQNETWLSVPRPTNIEVKHFHSIPLGKFGQYLDLKHETIRWHSKILGRLLIVLDRTIFFPFRGYVPAIKKSKRIEFRDEVFEVQFPDTYLTYKWKEVAYFKYFLENSNADYLVSISNSSYVNLRVLGSLVNNLPETLLYYGPRPFESAEFVSGSFRIFSRDVVKKVVDKRKYFDHAKLEDVAVGLLLKRLGIQPTFTRIENLSSYEEIDRLSQNQLKLGIHFRLKSGTPLARNDVPLMSYLHKKVESVSHPL
jgi:Galactosyltransferase